jgi:hypothetical protein
MHSQPLGTGERKNGGERRSTKSRKKILFNDVVSSFGYIASDDRISEQVVLVRTNGQLSFETIRTANKTKNEGDTQTRLIHRQQRKRIGGRGAQH